MSSARLCRSAPFVALLVLFLIAAPATAARKHHAPKNAVGSALGVMPDKTAKPVRLRAHALQTIGGVSTDTNAFPATVAGCPLTDGTNTVANCLTQTQEATELDNFIQANSLPRGIDHIYFLVLPDNVETCVDDFSDCGNILDT